MNYQEREKVTKAWASASVLCGILDPNTPEEFFPKGRLSTAHNQALNVFRILDSIISNKKFQNEISPN